MMKPIILTVLVSISTALSNPELEKKELSLKFQLNEGVVYGQRTTMVSKTRQVLAAREINYGQSASAETYMELIEAGDSSSTYSMWYGDIGMGFDQGGMKQRFASDTSNLLIVDPMSRIFSNMVENKFQARVSHSGKFEEIFGLEEIISTSVGKNQSENSELTDQISSGLGDGGLAKNLEVVTAVIPDEPIQEGSTWTKKQFSSSGLPLIINNTYTVESITDEALTLKVDGAITMDPAHTGAVVGGLDVVYSLTGKRTGTIKLETSTGWIIEAELVDDIDGKILMMPNEQFPNGTEIPMEMDNTTTVSRIKP